MDWFLYDSDLRHERDKLNVHYQTIIRKNIDMRNLAFQNIITMRNMCKAIFQDCI